MFFDLLLRNTLYLCKTQQHSFTVLFQGVVNLSTPGRNVVRGNLNVLQQVIVTHHIDDIMLIGQDKLEVASILEVSVGW